VTDGADTRIPDMMTILRILIVCLLLAIVRVFLRRAKFSGNVVEMRADDPGLTAAKARAVETLPEFLRRLALPGTDHSTVAIKAPFKVPGGTEHVWITNVRSEGNEFVGTVDNSPTRAAGVVAGAPIRVRHTEISDWKLVERGRLVGGFTIRYFMSLMPEPQRLALAANLPFTIGPDALPPAA
jgi:uncharacterized protein YegJ (DUF2314 family)